MENTTYSGPISIAGEVGAKQSPLAMANNMLSDEVSHLEEFVGVLFDSLNPVLSPDVPRDEQAEATQSQPPQSEQVEYLKRQSLRLAQVRHRLEYLRSRLEV